MNHISDDIIELICSYSNLNDMRILRECSKYIGTKVTRIYFNKLFINAKFVIEVRREFRKFVHKYKLSFNIYNITCYKELLYFLNFDVNCMLLDIYIPNYEYLIPFSLKC